MTTTYEKVAEKYLLEDEMLWSVYHFNHNLACITDSRLILISTRPNSIKSHHDISLLKIKLIITRHSSRLKSTISIYSDGEVFHLKVESERVNKFVNDLIKHKNSNVVH